MHYLHRVESSDGNISRAESTGAILILANMMSGRLGPPIAPIPDETRHHRAATLARSRIHKLTVVPRFYFLSLEQEFKLRSNGQTVLSCAPKAFYGTRIP